MPSDGQHFVYRYDKRVLFDEDKITSDNNNFTCRVGVIFLIHLDTEIRDARPDIGRVINTIRF